MEEKSYKEFLHSITTFIFDVDGVLTDGQLYVRSNGELERVMNVKDGYALKTAIDKGYQVCIISGGKNEGVRKRLEGLGIQDIYLGVSQKTIVLEEYMKTHSLAAEQIVYMGDDVPDYEVMQKVGMPCCPQDAVQEIKSISRYISHKKGGNGAVRDILEQVMKVQGKWSLLHADAQNH